MPVPKAIREYVSGLGIQLDIMDTVSLLHFITDEEETDERRETLVRRSTCFKKKEGKSPLLCVLSPR